jgi:hypothetical protein
MGGPTFEDMNKASNPVPLAELAPKHGLTKDLVLAEMATLMKATKPQTFKVKGIFNPWGDDEDLPDHIKVLTKTTDETVLEATYADNAIRLSTTKLITDLLDWKPAQKFELTTDADDWLSKVFDLVANSNTSDLPSVKPKLQVEGDDGLTGA